MRTRWQWKMMKTQTEEVLLCLRENRALISIFNFSRPHWMWVLNEFFAVIVTVLNSELTFELRVPTHDRTNDDSHMNIVRKMWDVLNYSYQEKIFLTISREAENFLKKCVRICWSYSLFAIFVTHSREFFPIPFYHLRLSHIYLRQRRRQWNK